MRNHDHIAELDTLRFIAILFVVINHLGVNRGLFPWMTITHATSPVLGFISSYLLFRSVGHPSQLVQKLKHRLISLIFPYILWTFIIFVATQIIKTVALEWLPTLHIFSRASPNWRLQEYWVNFFLSPNPGAFWYLQNLIVILPFTFLIYYIVKPKHIIIPLLFAIAILYKYNLVPFFSVRFLPYYIFGAWLGTHRPSKLPNIAGNRYALLFLLITLLSCNEYIFHYFADNQLIVSFVLQIAISLIAASAINLFGTSVLLKYINHKLYASFYLHASHAMVLSIFAFILSILIRQCNLNSIYLWPVFPVVLFVTTFAFITQMAKWMKAKTPQIYNALSGKQTWSI